MRWWPYLLLAAGCGRLGFDLPGEGEDGPPAEAGADPPADGTAPGDGAAGACRTNALYVSRGALPHRYRTVASNLSWVQARTACGDDGAYLAIPDDAAEAALLDGDWMGLTDAAVEGQWLTVFGAPAPFLPWAAGEPDGGVTENCARLDDNTLLLEARACADMRDYICECD